MTSPVSEPYESSAAFQADLATISDAMQAVRSSPHADARVLHELVRAAAVRARENRMPPEKLVRALKALVREVALHDASDAYRVIYTDRIIAWAIEAYYELSPR
jgi:phage-related protein